MREPSASPGPVVITGVGPMCPGAVSVPELLAAAPEREAPDEGWFDAPRFLGAKGYKYLTAPTRYLLAAAAQAFADAGLRDGDYPPEGKGVFVGTNFGAHRTLEDMDRVILGEGSEALQPMNAPNFSVNIPSSQLSIKHKLQAFNITLTAAMVAGAQAVILGAAAIRAGRAQLVVAGAAEDTPTDVAGLIGAPFVTGAACALTLESAEGARRRGAREYAQIGESALLFANPTRPGSAGALADRIDGALLRMLPVNSGPVPVAVAAGGSPLGRAVSEIVRASLERRGIGVEPASFVGASGAFLTASPLLQLGGLAAGPGRGLLVAAGPQGHVALLALDRGVGR